MCQFFALFPELCFEFRDALIVPFNGFFLCEPCLDFVNLRNESLFLRFEVGGIGRFEWLIKLCFEIDNLAYKFLDSLICLNGRRCIGRNEFGNEQRIGGNLLNLII